MAATLTEGGALSPPARFRPEAEALGVAFDEGDVERLGRYLALLLETNRRFNLTAIDDPDEAWIRHVLDALTVLPVVVSVEATMVCDVGSGGGLPAVPLAIVLPGVEFTLIEATRKKARFLRSVTHALDLGNVHVVSERAETVGRDEVHRGRYDLVTARALGRLPVLLELTVPLARAGGHVVAIKGQKAEEEIVESKAALHLLHARVAQVQRTPTGTLVVIEKGRATPKAYPRRPGEPKRAPLG